MNRSFVIAESSVAIYEKSISRPADSTVNSTRFDHVSLSVLSPNDFLSCRASRACGPSTASSCCEVEMEHIRDDMSSILYSESETIEDFRSVSLWKFHPLKVKLDMIGLQRWTASTSSSR